MSTITAFKLAVPFLKLSVARAKVEVVAIPTVLPLVVGELVNRPAVDSKVSNVSFVVVPTQISIVFVNELQLFEETKVIVFVPAVEKVTDGFAALLVDGLPPGNVQVYKVAPVDEGLKVTLSPVAISVFVAVKLAVIGFPVPTVIKLVAVLVLFPFALIAFKVVV